MQPETVSPTYNQCITVILFCFFVVEVFIGGARIVLYCHYKTCISEIDVYSVCLFSYLCISGVHSFLTILDSNDIK